MHSDSVVEDILSSAILGGILGFSVFLLLDGAHLTDQVFRQMGLSRIGGRLNGFDLAVLGAILGVALDLIGNLTA